MALIMLGLLNTAYAAATLSPTTQTVTGTVNVALVNSASIVAAGFTGAVTYTISPALSAGLVLNASTGVVSGTPTAAKTLTKYTITATGATAGKVTTVLNITINNPPALTPATQAMSGYAGSALTASKAFTAANFSGALSYTVSPALPGGLTLNATTGAITGTPTAAQALASYTITGTGATSGSATSTVTITVLTPSIASATQTVSGTTGKTLTATSAFVATGLSGTVSYAIAPALPAGLSFSTSNGVISGTPTAISAQASYTVTATGATGGTATAQISLGVVAPPPALTPATQTVSGVMNTAIKATTAFTASNFTGVVSYSINPALSAGLSLNASTGVLSGTPTVDQAATSYTITASDGISSANATVSISIALPPATLTPTSQSVIAQVGMAITPTSAYVGNYFAGVVSYAITPALPGGLTLDPATGIISGTPATLQAATSYSVTALGATSGTASSKVTITVLSPALSPLSQTVSGTVGKAVTASSALVASGFSGTVSYAIAPALPAGLSFSTSNGVISGTPTAVSALASYTVTAKGATGGIATASISLSIAPPPPALTPATQTLSGVMGTAVTATGAFTASNFTGVVSYTISPALSAGLSLNASSGVVSGIPTVAQALTSYTITATDGTGSATATLSITITMPPATLTPALQTVIAQVGIANTPTSAYVANYFAGAVSYSISPALPAGLTLDTTTGIISGTPTTQQLATSYSITAKGATSGTAYSTVAITVLSPAITPATQTLSGTMGKALTASSAFVASGFSGTVSYAIAPAVPAGLTFSTSKGTISGTPTAISALASYTVTATGSTGGIATALISLTIAPPPPAITPANQTLAGVTGSAVKATSAFVASNFAGAVSYTISPALSAGLSLNASTGVISGVPSVVQAVTSYTVTATSGTGTATASISITITPPPTGITPATQTLTAAVGAAITPTTAFTAVSFGGAVTYTVSPALPAGLTINATTGAISGTATTAQAATTYTVTAKGATSGSATATVSISVVLSTLSPASQTVSGTVGISITATSSFVATGFTGTITYTIAPALPAGLSMSSKGVISGKPTAVSALTSYTVTATGATRGSATSLLSIVIVAPPPVVTPATQTLTGVMNTAVKATKTLVATNFTGAVSYTISPALSAGLSLNASTGVISGVPTIDQVLTSYTITATDTLANTATATISITIALPPPSLTPTSQSVIVPVGAAITPTAAYVANYFVGAVSYSIIPALPAGLAMDSTGVISGTPIATQPATTYTVTATGATSGVVTAIVIISVPPAAITPGAQAVSGKINTAIKATKPFTPSYFSGVVSYSIAPALTSGLVLDSTTGIISGTPTTIQLLTAYTITATDGLSGSATALVNITILPDMTPTSQTLKNPVNAPLPASAAITPIGFAGIVAYTISPALPTGLVIDSTTGIISGTPVLPQAATKYTLSASDGISGTATATVSIAITNPPNCMPKTLSDAEEGRRAYMRLNCYSCHGMAGTGGMGPKIVGEGGGVKEVVPNGSDGGMPAFGDYTCASDVVYLSAYLNSLNGKNPPAFKHWWEPAPSQ